MTSHPSSPIPHPSPKGFTLVELLVVIAIIGILAGVLLATFGGATDSARAAQCISNMRSLAVAANSYAMQNGAYPLAGSCETMGVDGTTPYYVSRAGWISWLSRGKYDDGKGNARAMSHRSNPDVPFWSDKVEDTSFALTNGTLWIAVSKNRALYTCPEHVLFCRNRNQTAPFFSYVMNARFGWDTTQGSRAMALPETRYGRLPRADKTLLFAELPTVDVEGNESEATPSGLKADCVLQYEAIASGTANRSTGPNASSGGEAESIGFVHKAGKNGRCAHVAFADGHTEKLIWRDGGVDPKKLTAYLCRGWDVIFDSRSGWSLAPDADKMD